jgi:4-coumarate--CoA ligase
MPFLAQKCLSIPTKDILSWMYDNPLFDQDRPVRSLSTLALYCSHHTNTRLQIYIDASNPAHHITAAQAHVLIRQLIAGFKYAGIQTGDVVLVHAFNSIYYPIIVLGIIGAGAIYTGTNPGYTRWEIEHALKSSGAKMVICDTEVLENGMSVAAQECGLPRERILMLDDTILHFPLPHAADDMTSWRSLLMHGEADWQRFDELETSRRTIAGLFFSSGTTGLPKLAKLSHYNLIAQHTLVFQANPRPYLLKRLIALPMFHAATAPSTHFSPLRAGQQQIVMRRYEPRSFLEMAEKHTITDLTLVPPQVTSMLAVPLTKAEKRRMLASVRWAVGGAAHLDATTQKRFQDLLPPGSPFTQIWGMTEVSCFGSIFPWPEIDDTGSVGKFLSNLDVKLLDDDGKDITNFDVRGELAVRGPTITTGYVGVARERDFDSEGYFRTGDMLYCDSRTRLWYIVDRKKELIKVRGFQVAPAELEGVILECPGVADVAVIGVNGGVDEELTEQQIKSWVEAKLAKYKRLDGGVVFVPAIPKSPSGKILKRVLKEEMIEVATRAKL